MTVATVTSKGQITIPKEIRDELGLTPGSKVDFVRHDDGRVELTTRSLRAVDLMGSLAYSGPTITLEQMDETIRDAARGR